MEDKLGFEIQDGDLVMDVGGGGCYITILHGGFTKGGKPRTLGLGGHKGYVKVDNLIKATPEQFIAFTDRLIGTYNGYIENYQRKIDEGDEDEGWYQKYINNYREYIEKFEEEKETILQMHQDSLAQR